MGPKSQSGNAAKKVKPKRHDHVKWGNMQRCIKKWPKSRKNMPHYFFCYPETVTNSY